MPIHSQKSFEGYLKIDHRAGPGLPGTPKMLELPTITCNHCMAVVVINNMRERPRNYCPNCDKYICDLCAEVRHTTLTCRPLEQIFDEVASGKTPTLMREHNG